MPSALERWEDISARLRGCRCAVFLDYDGTLTPIVGNPEDAVLDDDVRRLVASLARRCPVAIVSGRDLADVRERVGLDDVYYAGSHGFEIAGPAGPMYTPGAALETLPDLDEAEAALRAALASIDGALVDRKRFSIAVHYRLVAEEDAAAVERAVDAAIAAHPRLRKGRGKKVIELQPDVDWHKGAAVRWLLGALHLDAPDVVPLYLGDDVTDHDAFEAIADHGIGIAVHRTDRPEAAAYRLSSPAEVRRFLAGLEATLAG
jgi:trehalose-phosphatase